MYVHTQFIPFHLMYYFQKNLINLSYYKRTKFSEVNMTIMKTIYL